MINLIRGCDSGDDGDVVHYISYPGTSPGRALRQFAFGPTVGRASEGHLVTPYFDRDVLHVAIRTPFQRSFDIRSNDAGRGSGLEDHVVTDTRNADQMPNGLRCCLPLISPVHFARQGDPTTPCARGSIQSALVR